MTKDIITMRIYRPGEVQEIDPARAMIRLFGLYKMAGFEPEGSTVRFQGIDPLTGDTIVFEVQDKREVY